jgi:uncharacterized protein
LGLPEPSELTFHFRIPTWAGKTNLAVNGQPMPVPASGPATAKDRTASGIDPRQARYIPIQRLWSSGDLIELEFEMPVMFRQAHPRVKGHKGKAALTRGPLVYCLERKDNPDLDIFNTQIQPDSLKVETETGLLGGILTLAGKTAGNQDFTAIPYLLWANRGESQMAVWVRLK